MVAHLGCVGFNLSVPLLARSREDGNLAEVAEQHVRDAGINKGKSAQPGWRQHTQPCIYERLGLAGGRAESERGYALFIMAAFKADHFSNNESLRSEGRRTRTGASPLTHLTLPLPYYGGVQSGIQQTLIRKKWFSRYFNAGLGRSYF